MRSLEPHLSLSISPLGTKKLREQQQRVAETAVSVILLCLPIVFRSLGVHEAGPDGVHPGGAA